MHNNHKMTEVRPKIYLIGMVLMCLIKDFQFGSHSKKTRICCTQEVELNKKIKKDKGIQIRVQTESINSNEDKTLINIYVYRIMQ